MLLQIDCYEMESAHPSKPDSGGQGQVPAHPF